MLQALTECCQTYRLGTRVGGPIKQKSEILIGAIEKVPKKCFDNIFKVVNVGWVWVNYGYWIIDRLLDLNLNLGYVPMKSS